MGKNLPEAVVLLCCVSGNIAAAQNYLYGEESVPVPPSKQSGHEMDIYIYIMQACKYESNFHISGQLKLFSKYSP